jgi:hypothetical protein
MNRIPGPSWGAPHAFAWPWKFVALLEFDGLTPERLHLFTSLQLWKVLAGHLHSDSACHLLLARVLLDGDDELVHVLKEVVKLMSLGLVGCVPRWSPRGLGIFSFAQFLFASERITRISLQPTPTTPGLR